MDRHLLVAVSEQKSAVHGVRFAGNFFQDKTAVKATFYYSSPKPPAVWGNEKNLAADQQAKAQERKLKARGKKALDEAVHEAVQLGFPKDNLSQKMHERIFTKAADIIAEGERGNYDAVVLGRRGMGMLEEAFEESVSKALFKDTFSFPLWLCRSSVPGRRHVLFHADGSPTSISMADHLGFMLGMERVHNIDILPTAEVQADPAAMERYHEILKSHGIGRDRISCIAPPRGDLASFILSQVDKTAYTAVALGRSNPEASLLSRLFKGPVCAKLFQDLRDAALLVCC